MTCTRCAAPASRSYKGLPMCRSHQEAAIVEEATAILERRAVYHAVLDSMMRVARSSSTGTLRLVQNDPAGTWSFEAPTYTLEGQ
jgi:hypothetical protein